MPPITGKRFIVLPSSSALISDAQEQYPVDEDGVVRVYTSLSSALSQCVANRGDVVSIMPGSYTISSNIALSTSGVTIEGMGPAGAVTIVTDTADTLTVTGDNFTMRNVAFTMAATLSSVVLTGCDNFLIEDCAFTTTAGGAGTYAIEMVTTANTNGTIRRCAFNANMNVASGSVTVAGFILGLGNNIRIEDCDFRSRRQTTANAGAVTAGVVFSAAADWGNIVRRCTFIEHNGATFTAGIDYGTTVTTGGVEAYDNRFLLATGANAIVNGSNDAGIGNQAPANGTV